MRNVRFGCALIVWSTISAAAMADTIKLAGGKKPFSDVSVLEENLDNVKYKSPKIRQIQQYPTENVVDVVYSNPPEEYELAQEALAANDFSAASSLFKAAAAGARSKKGLEARCLYLAADALRQGGMASDAVNAFDSMISKFPQSRYMPMATLAKGTTLARGGDAAKARQSFQKLKSFGERWDLESQLQMGILDEAKDPVVALDLYKRLVSATDRKYPAVANQAKLRIGRSLIAGKKFAEAQTYFETILEDQAASPAEIVAGAYNGLGASLWNKPGATPDDWKRALYQHLRVYVSFPEVVDEQPEALYSIGKCFQQVPGPESAARANFFLRRCVSLYPNTTWGQKAQGG